MGKVWVLAVAAAALFSASAAALQPCAISSFAAPARSPISDADPEGALVPMPANPLGCALGVPLDVDPGVTVWRCRIDVPEDVEPPEDFVPYGLVLIKDGQAAYAAPDYVMAGAYEAMHVVKADLDGDGRDERVLATWNTQGNGLGVHRWTVRVFDRDWTLLRQFDDVAEWGRSSVVDAPGARPGCDLAISEWTRDEDPRRGEGVALEARFFTAAAGAVVAADRPPARRRLLYSFSRERAAHFRRDETNFEGDVAAWLR